MKLKRYFFTGIALAMGGLLAGCGIAPVQKGENINLGPNEGIAAVVTDSLNVLSQFEIDGTDPNGATMKIPTAPVGVSLYLFVVPAGHYCVTRYSVGMSQVRDPGNTDCFDVVAGKTAYSGNFAPRAFSEGGTWGRNGLEGYDVRTLQNFDWDGIKRKLQTDYPDVVAKYPLVTP